MKMQATNGTIGRKEDIIAAVTRLLDGMDASSINGFVLAITDANSIQASKGGDSLTLLGLTNYLTLKIGHEAGFVSGSGAGFTSEVGHG